MSHRLPPVTGESLNVIAVTYIYQGAHYFPFADGEIRVVDYQEDGIILSFPFPDAFTTVLPALTQDGRLFHSQSFLRYIAENGTHNWETGVLGGLTAADFVAVDGSGDSPDFINGSQIRFGFTRINSRSSTLPPVPPDQDLVIDHGVDNWRVTIHRDNTEQPPEAVDDRFVIDGSNGASLQHLDVKGNDSDPNEDSLTLLEVTEPMYGEAGVLGAYVAFLPGSGNFVDTFSYTIGDGALTDSAQVEVLIDCACTLACLNLTARVPSSPEADDIDLPLLYRVRDELLKPTRNGHRYVEMYYTSNPEILFTVMLNESLRAQAVATVEMWQDNLRSLVYGDGSAIISPAQVEAISSFLSNLSAAGSPELQQLISDELARLGPLTSFVGLTMRAAKELVAGPSQVYLPALANR
jgi:hypothetical protein